MEENAHGKRQSIVLGAILETYGAGMYLNAGILKPGTPGYLNPERRNS